LAAFDFHFNSFDGDSIESWMEATRRRVRAFMVSRMQYLVPLFVVLGQYVAVVDKRSDE
jgi:hypothetical protein